MKNYKIYLDTTDRLEKKARLLELNENKTALISELSGNIDIVSAIKTLLEDNNLSFDEVVLVEPNLGPGSFTGLRVGVTIANVLNWAAGKTGTDNMFVPKYDKEPNIHTKP